MDSSDDLLELSLQALASCIDIRGELRWVELASGTSSQIRIRRLPDALALFVHEAFGGRITRRVRTGGYDLVISGEHADSLVQHVLPYLTIVKDWFSLYHAARQAIVDMRMRSGTTRVSPAEKEWRREVQVEFDLLKAETIVARGRAGVRQANWGSRG